MTKRKHARFTDFVPMQEELKRLRAEHDDFKQLKELVKQLKWKSVEKDNMEFEVRMTCYVRDELMRFADT